MQLNSTNNTNLKIVSIQSTYYKPGHLRPVLMLRPHYSNKCNCGNPAFVHVLAKDTEGNEYVCTACSICQKGEVCSENEAHAAIKTGIWADYGSVPEKDCHWEAPALDETQIFFEIPEQDACSCGCRELSYYELPDSKNCMLTCCLCGRSTTLFNKKHEEVKQWTAKYFDPDERDDWTDEDQSIYDSVPKNERYSYGLTYRSVVEAFKAAHSKKDKETPQKMEF